MGEINILLNNKTMFSMKVFDCANLEKYSTACMITV